MIKYHTKDMKKILIAALACALLAPTAAVEAKGGKSSKKKEPVVATVNGRDVTLGELEYLYKKNNSQQTAPQSLDEYLDMFIVYKLKVADAESEGIDTTANFRREYKQYVSDLAAPYLRDKAMADSLLNVAYDHKKTERKFSFIQLPLGEDNHARLDSIRNCVINGEDFTALAIQYSIDPNVRRSGGELGFISGGMIPYEIEDPVYTTPIGDYSPVFDTRYGVLFVHPIAERANRGERKVRHILKLTQGASPEKKAEAKAQIDSLLTLIKNGADFAEVAKMESEDPGSRDQGGLIQWFGSGRMVPEFEEAAFSLAPGEISDVVETAYGYHIIKGEDARSVGTLDEERPGLEATMERNGMSKMPLKRVLKGLRGKYGVTYNPKARTLVKTLVETAGQLDSTVFRPMVASPENAATVGDRAVTLKDMSFVMVPINARNVDSAMNAYDTLLEEEIDKKVMELAIEDLPEENADFRNVINEYRDGILLYEVSNKNVWNRANTDKEGLEKYFEENRDKFSTWTEPRYKGYVMLATNDSVAAVAKEITDANPGMPISDLSKLLKEKVGNQLRMEKVLAKKGDNAVVDYAAFGGEKPAPHARWSEFFIFNGKFISQPEEVTDVRGTVNADWQQYLEKEWVKSLREKYPVTINKKVLKKLK